MLRGVLLGGFAVLDGDSPLAALHAPAVRSLLAFLLLHREAPQSRQHVAFALYPDNTDAQAQTNLRKCLHRLRASWPSIEAYLIIDKGALAWRSDAVIETDAAAFDAALRDGDFERALAHYRGDLLPEEPGEWAVLERERLRSAYLKALSDALADCEDAEPARALALAERLIHAEPLREDAHRAAIRLHARIGDAAGVTHAYQHCQHLLRDELGIDPSPLTRGAFDDALARASRPGATRGQLRHSPAFAAPFLGRTDELAKLTALLADPDNRLITIHAPGGMGKTRLMHALLRRAADDGHDCAWVSFEDTNDAASALPRIATALSIRHNDSADAGAQLREHLSKTQVLLGLDNVESVTDAAPALAALLKDCPSLRIVATSRDMLRLSWERVFDLGALDTDSRALFVQAARRVSPDLALTHDDWPLIDEICDAVGAMPLAIELAAAQTRELSLRAIRDEIASGAHRLTSPFRDAPPRQRSIADVLAWSCDRLDAADRAALERLSIFRGGLTIDLTARLLAMPLDHAERTLRRLTGRQLLKRSGAQFRMHSLIQQFSHDALEKRGRLDDARGAHARLITAWAGETGARFVADDVEAKREAGTALRDAANDLRAALDWLTQHDPDAGLMLGHAVFDYWLQSGQIAEARRAFEALLPRLAGVKTREHARAVNRLGILAMFVGDYELALLRLEAARQAYLELGDEAMSMRPLSNMIIAARHTGDYARTITLANAVLEALGADHADPESLSALLSASVAYLQMAVALSLTGRHDAALACMDRALTLLKRTPDPYYYETEQAAVGYILLNQRDYTGAQQAYARCMEYSLRTDARAVFVSCLYGCAGVAAECGQPDRAARLFGAGHRIRGELGLPLPRVYPVYERTLAAARASLSEAEFSRLLAEGAQLSDAEAAELARNR